ncbi:DUF5689 domain-containing protein [Riemerella columbina]|uniref:DUF5689 domain-containing protein n=1 Tax=Riemerella columbina TaxID=103810 RepID=UPI00267011DB|nr:DUF5689 domain-containing protein [Riemerella columbina]WKS95075.1 DUF5689 domain-containing protein [Riemerella columbina]
MKTTVYLKVSLLALASLGSLTSCVKDDEFDIPKIECQNQFTAANSSIKEVKDLSPTPQPPTYVSNYKITDDLIFDGYVISSDEEGNFYKQLTIQDDPENPTAGIQIAINKASLYTDYPVGAHVRIKAKGLSVGEDRGVVKLGYEKPTGQIQESKMSEFISGVCGGNTLDIKTIKPKVVNSIDEATTDENINTLVTIKNVQFADADGTLTYADVVNNITTDRTLIDKNGNQAVLRNSGYAKFAGKVMPKESGEITAVVTKYTSGKNVTWQLYIRDLDDVKFDQPRFVDGSKIYGGGALEYKTSFTENFEQLSNKGPKYYDIDDDRFLNYAESGNRYWGQGYYSKENNRYLKAQAFGYNGEGKVKISFMIPAEFTGSSKLSFQTQNGYYKGDVLKVYYTTKYVPGSELNTDDLVDITSKFTISQGSINGYPNIWTDSGEVVIPATGKGFIIFQYVGDKEITTTMQVDNVTLK